MRVEFSTHTQQIPVTNPEEFALVPLHEVLFLTSTCHKAPTGMGGNSVTSMYLIVPYSIVLNAEMRRNSLVSEDAGCGISA